MAGSDDMIGLSIAEMRDGMSLGEFAAPKPVEAPEKSFASDITWA